MEMEKMEIKTDVVPIPFQILHRHTKGLTSRDAQIIEKQIRKFENKEASTLFLESMVSSWIMIYGRLTKWRVPDSQCLFYLRTNKNSYLIFKTKFY